MIKKHFAKKYTRSGLTIIELMVSVAIATVIMSIVFINYSKFNDDITLTSAVQEMSLAIRQAQVYGLSVKQSGAGSFDHAYGIYFNPTVSQTKYYIFVDTNDNQTYEGGTGCGSGNTECIEEETIRGGAILSAVCDNVNCPPSAGVQALSITFKRPSTDAIICFANISNNCIAGTWTTSRIQLTSRQGRVLTVRVDKSGQISSQ